MRFAAERVIESKHDPFLIFICSDYTDNCCLSDPSRRRFPANPYNTGGQHISQTFTSFQPRLINIMASQNQLQPDRIQFICIPRPDSYLTLSWEYFIRQSVIYVNLAWNSLWLVVTDTLHILLLSINVMILYESPDKIIVGKDSALTPSVFKFWTRSISLRQFLPDYSVRRFLVGQHWQSWIRQTNWFWGAKSTSVPTSLVTTTLHLCQILWSNRKTKEHQSSSECYLRLSGTAHL